MSTDQFHMISSTIDHRKDLKSQSTNNFDDDEACDDLVRM